MTNKFIHVEKGFIHNVSPHSLSKSDEVVCSALKKKVKINFYSHSL